LAAYASIAILPGANLGTLFPLSLGDFKQGAGRRIRTDDLLITNQLLYQLSYAGAYERKLTCLTALSSAIVHASLTIKYRLCVVTANIAASIMRVFDQRGNSSITLDGAAPVTPTRR
jgi:hypothetical protein